MDIGIDPEFLFTTATEAELIGKYEVLSMYRPREKFAHKGTYGHSLIIGGSYGKIGSVVLASKAALVAGSGLVSSFVPRCGYTILQTSIPEVMVATDKNEDYITSIEHDIEASVVGFGIGAGN